MKTAIWSLALAALLTAGSAAAVDLRYGTKGLPTSHGNPYTGNGSPSNFVWSAMFDGLTRLDKDGAIAPALATGWKATAPTSWEFTLRRGVTFTNGEAFDAQAVVATLAWLRTPDGARTIVGNEIRGVVAAEATDTHTVVLRTARPDPILPARLSGVMIVAPKAWKELGVEAFSKTPAGTGPFAAKDWGGGARVTLAAHPESWRKPKVDRLIIINLPDNATRMQALLAGQVDIAGNIGVDDLDSVEAAGFLSATGPGMSVMSIAYRQQGGGHQALKDPRVRQALNYAVDKESINKVLLRGLSPPSGQPAAKGVVGYNPDVKPYPYDPAKAKALLAEAGYPNGFPLKIEVMVDRSPGDRGIFETMSAGLRQAGIQVELRTVTFGAWMEAYLSGNWAPDTDAFLLSFNAAPYNDVTRPMEIYTCLRPNGFVCDKDVTAKFTDANEEMDPARRTAKLQELAKVFHTWAPALYLTELFDIFGFSRKVEGFSLANRVPEYEKISVKK